MKLYTAFRTLVFLAFCTLLLISIVGCNADDADEMAIVDDPTNGPDNPDSDALYSTGLNADDNLATMPVSPNFGFGNANLPSSVDLTMHLPPVGNQGSYGTCVAFAVGYNLKTALNAIDNGETTAQLADTRKIGSAKYLFTAIPDNLKGNDCNGTHFEPALDIVLNKGLASEAAVPYTNLGGCSQVTADPAWDQAAGDNKISNYRRIEGSIVGIKQALADKSPVVLGARLGQAFMEWRGDGVISSNGAFDPNNQHGNHAMLMVGYDDAKGPRGAFRVVNSWDTGWGDDGFIWIDYDFLVNEMLMRDQSNNGFVFTATNIRGTTPDDNQPNPNDNTSSGGAELLTWIYEETVNPDGRDNLDRQVVYDIYNFGERAQAASDWDIYYVYYNAYNANDYGVLFHNRIVGNSEGVSCDNTGCDIDATIDVHSSLGYELFGSETIGQPYTIPQLTGEYYLMMVADGEDEIDEYDETDNYFFPSLTPITFSGGIPMLQGGAQNGLTDGEGTILSHNARVAASTPSGFVAPERPQGNAYSLTELKTIVSRDLASGRLADLAQTAQASSVRSSAAATR